MVCIGMIYPLAELADNINANEKGMNFEDSYYSMESYSDRGNDELQEDMKYNYFSYEPDSNVFVRFLAKRQSP